MSVRVEAGLLAHSYRSSGYQPDYQVDYGTDSIPLSDALARIRRDSDQNQQEMERSMADRAKLASDVERLGAALFPAHPGGTRASLFLADSSGETVAAILVVFFGRRATYLYGGSSLDHRHVMPSYALHWAAMQAARARGCREYDLYGYDPFGLPDHLYAGISRFKRQFGGIRCDRIGAYDCLFYDRLAERLISELSHTAANAARSNARLSGMPWSGCALPSNSRDR